MRWLALVVMALALVAAGCGGGDDESAASDETTVEETTTTADETTDESTGTGDLSAILDDEDCLKLASIGASFAQAITGATDEEAVEAFQQLVDEVPDEIKADVQVLADWFAEYSAKLDEIGLEAGATPTAEQIQELQTALAATNQQEVTAASERLGVWANENCTTAGG